MGGGAQNLEGTRSPTPRLPLGLGVLICVVMTHCSFASVPQDYSYLPENSILHSLHSLLEGCHSNTTPAGRRLLCAILQTVVHTKGDFPPVNWSRLLLPCLRAGICSHGDSLEKDCIASLPQLFGSQQLIIYCIHPLVLTHLQVS